MSVAEWWDALRCLSVLLIGALGAALVFWIIEKLP